MINERLKELYEKQKIKNKLNKTESKEAYELILENMRLCESIDENIDLIMTFSPEVGVKAFVDFLRNINNDKSKEILEKFLNSDVFTMNKNNKSVKRGMALVAMLYNKRFDPILIETTLKKVTELTIITSKTKVNNQIVEYVYKEFFKRIKESFFNTKENRFNLTEKEFYYVERVFLNTCFNSSQKIKVSPKEQFEVLEWLNSFKNVVNINEDEKEKLNKCIKEWPQELKTILEEDNVKIDKYYKYIELDSIKIEKENNLNIDIEKSGEHKVQKEDKVDEDINKIIKCLFKDIDCIKSQILSREKEIKNLRVNLSFYKNEYKKIKKENEELKTSLNNLSNKNEEINKENITLKMKVDALIRKNVQMEKFLIEYKNKVRLLHETNNMLESNSLQEFKNKLAGKLKVEYLDFKEVENEEIDKDIAEILKIKLANIFNELIKQGINL